VELPAGVHRVTIGYRPAGLEYGVAITLASTLLLAILAKLDVSSERLAVLLGRFGRFGPRWSGAKASWEDRVSVARPLRSGQ
jgi:hypothetical protein